MPASEIKAEKCTSLLDVEQLAKKYSVSPSAFVMRLYSLGKINEAMKASFLTDLFSIWDARCKDKRGGRQLEANTAIVRYNNRAVVDTLIKKYESKALNESDFRNLLCMKKGEHLDLEAIRNA